MTADGFGDDNDDDWLRVRGCQADQTGIVYFGVVDTGPVRHLGRGALTLGWGGSLTLDGPVGSGIPSATTSAPTGKARLAE